jgi:hypothetical protein
MNRIVLLSLLVAWRISASLLSILGFHDPSPWVQFTASPTLTVFADSSRVEKTATDGRIVWLRFDYRTPHHLRSADGTYVRTIVHTEVECKARRAKELRAQLYDANGTVVIDETFNPPTWHPFDGPGMGPHLYDPLCAWLAGRGH